MIQEYKRYLRSKVNWILFLTMWIPIALSYYSTESEKLDWLTQYQHPGSDIINPADLLITAKEYNAYTYLSQFLFSIDPIALFILILLIGFALVSGVTLCRDYNEGYGNLLVSRIGFKQYCRNVIVAQNLYIATAMAVLFLIQFAVTFLLFPVDKEAPTQWALGNDPGDAMHRLLPMLIQCVIILVFVLLILNITLLLASVIRNRYVLQFIPFIVYLVPDFLIRTIQTVNYWAGTTLTFLSPNDFLSSYYNWVEMIAPTSQKLLAFAVFPVIAFAVCVVLYKRCKRFEREYL